MIQRESSSHRFVPLSSLAAIVLWLLAGISAVVLGGRAVAGAFDEPVHGLIPCIATSIGLASSLIAWQLYVRITVSVTPMQRLLIGLFSLVPTAVIGFSTALQSSPVSLGVTTGLLLIGLVVVVVCEAMRIDVGQTNMSQSVTPIASSVSAFDVPADEAPLFPEEPSPIPTEDTDRWNSEPGQSNLIQRITRSREADGSEMIEATLAATFAAGAKEVAIHFPIHPVLSGTLHVECEPLDDSEVTVAVTTVQLYGIRIEMKRSKGFNEALTVPVGIAVTASSAVANVA